MTASHPASSIFARFGVEEEQGRSFEYLVLTAQPHESLADVRRRVVEHAEYGKWELRKSTLYTGGARKYWLRRRKMTVVRTA